MDKKIKAIIVEDEPLAAEGLKSYVREIEFLELVAHCENALEANKMISQHAIDLMFLDIQMPKLTGIDFLKSLNQPPMVIFTTAYPNYALQGYELDIIDYLVKPYPFDRFLKAVNKARDLMALRQASPTNPENTSGTNYFFVKTEQKLERININEICYIEGMENYVVIHTSDQKIMSLMTMKSMQERLPVNQFIRIHKSYIVNTEKVRSIEGNMLIVKTASLPVSRQKRQEVMEKLIKG